MQIELRTKDVPLSRDLQDYVNRKIDRALDHFRSIVRSVSVSIFDTNGPKGGRDIACRIEAVTRDGKQLNVREVREDPFAAVSRATPRLVRRVARQIERRRTRRRGRGLAALGLAFALTGCAGIRVHSEPVVGHSPLAHDSYAWVDFDEELPDSLASEDRSGEDLEREVRQALEAELSTLGLRLTTPAEADVLLDYRLEVDERLRRDAYVEFATRERYELGRLELLFLEPRTREPIWRGAATSELRLAAIQEDPWTNELYPTNRERDWKLRDKVSALLERLRADQTQTES